MSEGVRCPKSSNFTVPILGTAYAKLVAVLYVLFISTVAAHVKEKLILLICSMYCAVLAAITIVSF